MKFKTFHYVQSCRKTLGNFPSTPPYIFQRFRTIERDENRESTVNRRRNKERAERRKKPGEHERNTRQRVRKSECHCRNLRTLTSSWLVPPSSSWSQPSPLPPLTSTPLLPRCSLCHISFSLSLSSLSLVILPARFASNPLLHLSLSNSSFLPSRDIHSTLSPTTSFVFPPREFQVFCDNSCAVKYSSANIECDDRAAMIERSIGQCNVNIIALSICNFTRFVKLFMTTYLFIYCFGLLSGCP